MELLWALILGFAGCYDGCKPEDVQVTLRHEEGLWHLRLFSGNVSYSSDAETVEKAMVELAPLMLEDGFYMDEDVFHFLRGLPGEWL
jgi:hypothetical protein